MSRAQQLWTQLSESTLPPGRAQAGSLCPCDSDAESVEREHARPKLSLQGRTMLVNELAAGGALGGLGNQELRGVVISTFVSFSAGPSDSCAGPLPLPGHFVSSSSL